MKLGLIGGGNIGQFLLQSVNGKQMIPNTTISGMFSRNQKTAQRLADVYQVINHESIESIIQSDVEAIVEAATVQVVEQSAAQILASGKDLILSSVGALADSHFYNELMSICQANGTKIHLPSGAVGGLDILKAAKSNGELEAVSITTTKPPHALENAPKDVRAVIFEGSASEAIKLYPKNINVSIILSLAGLGPEKTNVKIISDPDVKKNSHAIDAFGAFGRLTLTIENDPMPSNPKTSYLAALSVLATLKNKDEWIRVG
ncbi:aspartate dehydrogenase [Cytobacillus horneckiae]|uniref:L-aspartate dehydrogenase n=1 Tax=Cytobacillus horneckiae TaxID=549687 RepID=A0A2N0ZAT0_9BACI|nr:aspartate dehydrogenase [Cytobacillus horneckiae]MBN6887371.1 aspartate dehydrogenase [Cytobacillus horneckiae]MCM3178039.1 aspartate dehydrogenase [Cytobacillus horneckiae]MEC1157221.1 aspartate dehydrogenase [Cytobacillus horneckiae]MED2938154.1 aspartate dehydrogenase [Cytobacillus horneckiae]PKG26610.1 aspartate dehydrogenase [Cytobacillus horneckiae]